MLVLSMRGVSELLPGVLRSVWHGIRVNVSEAPRRAGILMALVASQGPSVWHQRPCWPWIAMHVLQGAKKRPWAGGEERGQAMEDAKALKCRAVKTIERKTAALLNR